MKLSRSHRIHAFTLIEMILSMIIAAIVITAAYQIIFYTKKQWVVFNNHQEELISLLQFKQTFSNDIDKSLCIKQKNKHTYYLQCNNDTILYSFNEVITRKTKKVTDTFNINVHKLVPHFLQSDSTTVASLTLNIISPLEIEANFNKHYTSYDLISLHPYGLE